MIDKIGTVPRIRCRLRIGSLSQAQITEVNRSLAVFFGLAGR